jgi:hypothetical protein
VAQQIMIKGFEGEIERATTVKVKPNMLQQ